MSNPQQYDSRLSELIWRAIKLRVSILLLCIVVLLITWSSLEVGNRKALEIDNSFCLKVSEGVQQIDLATWKLQQSPPPRSDAPANVILGSADYCSRIGDLRYWIQYQQLALESSLWDPKTPEAIRKLQQSVLDGLADYDIRRKEAFRLDVRLSSGYSESSIEANALSVAEVIPFIAVGLLVLYFMIGFQEAGLRTQLRLQLDRHGSEEDNSPDLFVSNSQYLVSPCDSAGSIWPPAFLYSPDRFATVMLLLSAIYLLFRVTGEFISELNTITDSIFWSYPFGLYTAVFAAVLILILSRRQSSTVAVQIGPVRTSTVRATISAPAGGIPRFLFGMRMVFVSVSKWVTLVLVAIAVGCMFFPLAWRDWGGPIYGYEWLLNHDPSNRWIGAAGQAMNLTLFQEVRFEILVALAFLVLCALSAFEHLLAWPRLRKIVRKLSFLGAVVVAFLSINYLIFMAILEAEAFDLLLRQGNEARGSMIFYDPGAAYWVFTII